MNARTRLATGVACITALGAAGAVALADGGDDFEERLTGYEEVPALSTTGEGKFRAAIRSRGSAIDYRLSYAKLEGGVLQAHIHLGQEGVNAGISAFLCTNLGNGPAGTQACPPAPATIHGTIRADEVVGPTAQGIEPRAIDELVRAMRAGATYANVHTDKYTGGEIRAQLEDRDGRGDR
jgi:hypothetical protein